ncbi:MAG: hypothetical protein ACI86M_003931 [Saprospiraceae bacterium]|jgi:hypothetical protein
MNKPSYYPVIIIVISISLFGVSSFIEFMPLQIKVFLLGKVGLVVGVIGLWLFTILPMWENSNTRDES